MKFKVLKPFFKLSNRQNYNIGEEIELSKEDAEAMLNDGFLSEIINEKAIINNKVVDIEIVKIKGKRVGTIKSKQND